MFLRLMVSSIICLLPLALSAQDIRYSRTDEYAELNRTGKNNTKEMAGKSNENRDGQTDRIEDRTAIIKKSIRYSVLAAVPVNTYVVSLLTWDWGKTGAFRFGREGWFVHNTYTGGADKMAHLFAHYLIMRILYNVYDYTESGGSLKWAYSVGITGFLALGIEIGDGFCRNQNGFSYSDLIMGMMGIGTAALLELFPAVDGFFSLSVEYFPTKYFQKNPQRLKWFMDDYSGWKFLANIKLAGFRYVGLKVPDFIKYIQFDVGYYTTGYTTYDYRWGELERTFNRKGRERNIYIGISVNLAEVIKDFFSDTNSLACRALQQPFTYYHVPLGAGHRFRL
ncbi:MAG: hypothetical protein A2176_00775 [Spirochaetes bacterium RBG_13_51_14]|nr:MAG: hypothetical protein A2176_00775 [Spirochaetes bacterium RBG_13_51_14]